MTAVPVLVLLSAAVALGAYLLLLYVRGVRKPVVIGFHLLLGVGALEQMALLLHGTPNGDAARLGIVPAAAIIAVSLMTALIGALFARTSRRTAEVFLAAHVTLGTAGFLVFLVWVWNWRGT
jgi:hypothetical protein